MGYVLSRADFVDDARKIGCSVAAIRAVAEVESAGSGFDKNLRPKTLFEGHLFYKFTKGKFAQSHPDLCYPSYTKKFYGKTREQEYNRLQRAVALDKNAAYLSTSWGTFQILGMNYAVCGCSTVEEFVQIMHKDANAHLELFTEFIINSRLDDELRELRWADFARIYNGPAYKTNAYDKKMANAYLKYVKEDTPDLKAEDETSVVSFWNPPEEVAPAEPGSFADLSQPVYPDILI